jgi:hypothetical protein
MIKKLLILIVILCANVSFADCCKSNQYEHHGVVRKYDPKQEERENYYVCVGSAILFVILVIGSIFAGPSNDLGYP